MRFWSREPDEDPRIDSILILLDTLTPAGRRDLANALLSGPSACPTTIPAMCPGMSTSPRARGCEAT